MCVCVLQTLTLVGIVCTDRELVLVEVPQLHSFYSVLFYPQIFSNPYGFFFGGGGGGIQ